MLQEFIKKCLLQTDFHFEIYDMVNDTNKVTEIEFNFDGLKLRFITTYMNKEIHLKRRGYASFDSYCHSLIKRHLMNLFPEWQVKYKDDGKVLVIYR